MSTNSAAGLASLTLGAWALAFIWVKIYEQNNMEMATMYGVGVFVRSFHRPMINPDGTVAVPAIGRQGS